MENNSNNSTTGLLEAIQLLDVHDHLCLIYETQEEQFSAVIPFIHIGLERGEKCIYIVDENTAEAVLHTMENYGIDVGSATASGQLIIANKKTAYLLHGFFDPDLMIQFLKENTELALKEGYTALRATGEMTWMLGGEPGVERLMEYEAKLNYFFPEYKALAICQYNVNKFHPEILKEVIETHPKVVVGGWVCKNFYYVPPDEFLHPEHPSNEIRRLLDNIITRETFERTLLNSKQELEKINVQLKEEITKRKETEESIQRIIEHSPIAMAVTTGSDERVLTFNKKFTEWFGYTTKDVPTIAHWWPRAYPDTEYRKLIQEQWSERIEYAQRNSTEIEPMEALVNCKDGTKRCIEFRAISVGELNIITFNDFTTRRNIECELQKTSELLEKIFSTTHILIAYLDTNFNFLKVNRAYAETDNNIPEFYVGKNHFDLFPNEENKTIFSRVAQTGIPHYVTAKPFEYAYHPERGVSHWDWSLLPVLDSNGAVTNLVLVLLNVTERIHAEEELKKSTEELRAFFSQSIDGCFFMMSDEPVRWDNTVDKEQTLDYLFTHQRITQINDAMLEQYGATREQFLNRTPNDFFKHDIAYGKKLWRQFFDAGKIRLESDERKMDGTQMWIEGEYIALYNNEEKITGFFGIQRDITDRKNAEENLRISEERYRIVADNTYDWEFWIDPSGTLIYNSPSCLRITGYAAEEFLQEPTLLSSIIHPKDLQRFILHHRHVTENKIPGEIEFCILDKTGVEHFIAHVCQPVFDESGNYLGKRGSNRDITDYKRAEVSLRHSEEKYRDIVTWAPIGIYQSTPDGTFITANARLAEMLGYDSMEEVLKCRMTKDIYFHDGEREKLIKQFDTIHNGSVASLEVQWKKKDGTPIWISLTTHAIRDEQKRTLYYEGFVQDISERKKMEQEKESLEAQLVQTQKLEAIGTLASGIAHDFNNILGIILGYNSLLRQKTPSDELIQKSTEVIDGAVTRGTGLVKQILTFARLTEIHFGPLDVNIISKEISKMLTETFPKTIVINLELEKNLPTIIADPTQIHQVFLNLCVNARDAMSSTGTLTLKTQQVTSGEMTKYFQDVPGETYLLFSISDTGCGMGEETKNRIFEPFFTTKEKGKGTGLGLSVVYGIVKSHNGFIRVESTLGKGTTFYVYFPIPEKIEVQQSENTCPEETIVGGDETILLVEDEPVLSELTKSFLEMNGYVVLTAKDGDEAISLYRSKHTDIDLVVTDMGLPKMTGLEVLIEMKKIKPETKLIFASGYIEPELKSLMFQNGAKFFLYKPYLPNELLKVIRNIIDMQ